MLKFNDEAVSTFGVYFKHANEHILLLYPNMDLSPMDFLKVVYGRQLVDLVASSELESLVTIKNKHKKGTTVSLEPLSQRVLLKEMNQD